MTRYIFLSSNSDGSENIVRTRKVVRGTGAEVVRTAPGSILVEATASQLRKLKNLLPDWTCTAERKTARLCVVGARAKSRASGQPSKIRDSGLLTFLSAPSEARISVIVEARRRRVASSTVAAVKAAHLGPPRPNSKGTGGSGDKVALLSQVEATKHELDCLGLTGNARRLEASGSFVVEVSPAQLRHLAYSPSVQAIRPNRLGRRMKTCRREGAQRRVEFG